MTGYEMTGAPEGIVYICSLVVVWFQCFISAITTGYLYECDHINI